MQQSCRSRHNSYHTESLPTTVANLVDAIPSSWNTPIIPIEHTSNTAQLSTIPMTQTNDIDANDENNINANNENTTNSNNRGNRRYIFGDINV